MTKSNYLQSIAGTQRQQRLPGLSVRNLDGLQSRHEPRDIFLTQNNNMNQRPKSCIHTNNQGYLTATKERYIDGWLHYKVNKFTFKEYWFVLKGIVIDGVLQKAFLYRFKDQNTHIQQNELDSMEIDPYCGLEIVSLSENSKGYEFTVEYNNLKLVFRTYDSINRDRWLYALDDLVAKGKRPSQLPSLIQPNIIPQCIFKFNKGGRRHSAPVVPSIPPRTFPISPRPLPGLRRGPEPVLPSIRNRPPIRPGRSIDSAISGNIYTQPTETKGSLKGISRTSSFKKNLAQKVPYYHGNIGREKAETRLRCRPRGAYLLRDQSGNEDYFALSYKDYSQVKHLLIKKTQFAKYQFEGNEFVTDVFNSPEIGVQYFMDRKFENDPEFFHPAPQLRQCTSEITTNPEYDTVDTLVAERPEPKKPICRGRSVELPHTYKNIPPESDLRSEDGYVNMYQIDCHQRGCELSAQVEGDNASYGSIDSLLDDNNMQRKNPVCREKSTPLPKKHQNFPPSIRGQRRKSELDLREKADDINMARKNPVCREKSTPQPVIRYENFPPRIREQRRKTESDVKAKYVEMNLPKGYPDFHDGDDSGYLDLETGEVDSGYLEIN